MNLIAKRRRLMPTLQLLSVVALAVLLGWLVVRGLDWGELGKQLYRFPLGLSALALGFFLAGIMLRAWRWHILFVNEQVSLLRLFLVQNAGIGLNNVSPIRVVSEPVQLMLLTRRDGITAGTALATLATEHLIDVLVVGSLLGLGVLLMPELQGFSIQLAGAVILAAISLLVFLIIVRGMEAIPGTGRVPFLRNAITSIKTLQSAPHRLFLSILGTIGHWVLLGLSGWVIAQGLDIDVGVAVVVVLFMGSIFMVSAVPSLPGGAITFEAAVVYTLSLFGVEGETALAFAILMHIIMFAPSTIIALFVLPREGIKVLGRRPHPAATNNEEPQNQ